MAGNIFVPIPPGIDSSIPTGPQLSAKFTLIGPTGARVVLNDPNDRDYIGMVRELTGLDSPEVRESQADLVQQDGGLHGDFFYGRRPITMTGLLLNPGSPDDRNRRMTKLMSASNAMRQDATLMWTLAGGYEQFVRVRRQQPLRITGAWQKEFQLAVVAADPRIYGVEHKVKTIRHIDRNGDILDPFQDEFIIENRGNATSFPLFTIYGPGRDLSIHNSTTGKSIDIAVELGNNDYLVVDPQRRQVLFNGTISRFSQVNFLSTSWWGLEPGANDVYIEWDPDSYAADSDLDRSYFTVQWRDAWI